jgi:hypothetical protein
MPQIRRELSLYRNGKMVGTYTVYQDNRSVNNSGVITHPPNQPFIYLYLNQHLAFTADGRYLSWAYETPQGITIYAFRIQQ